MVRETRSDLGRPFGSGVSRLGFGSGGSGSENFEKIGKIGKVTDLVRTTWRGGMET